MKTKEGQRVAVLQQLARGALTAGAAAEVLAWIIHGWQHGSLLG